MEPAGFLASLVFVAALLGVAVTVEDGKLCGQEGEPGSQREAGLSNPRMVTSVCGSVMVPENGRMNLTVSSNDKGLWEVATFGCERGHSLVGPSSLVCRNGSWEGKEPTCKPVGCGDLEPILNGKVQYVHTTYQSKAYYSCGQCYKLFGVVRRSCKKSGQWSKTVPFCLLQECVLPELQDGLYVKKKDSQDKIYCGKSFEVGCFLGYHQEGAIRGTCLSGGAIAWEGPQPRCTKLNW